MIFHIFNNLNFNDQLASHKACHKNKAPVCYHGWRILTKKSICYLSCHSRSLQVVYGSKNSLSTQYGLLSTQQVNPINHSIRSETS